MQLTARWNQRHIFVFGRKPNRQIFFCCSSFFKLAAIFKMVVIFKMAAMRRPDPELLPVPRPRCPNCQTRMIAVAIASGPEGFERRTFECRKCGHCETDVVANDPLNSDAVGWTAGELRPPQ
jgi:hypothetical protein